jgi:hypothetical protein
MKKQLLVGSALLTAVSAYSQTARPKPASHVNMTEIIAQKFALESETNNNGVKLNIPPSETSASEKSASAALPPTQISWKALAGSMNVYGMLVNTSRPLQYNDNVNALSFIHRKSDSYVVTPSAEGSSGTIVAQISSNWGATWDSTAVWANATHGGRYPQGAIYSAPGNSVLANAYVVASGPIVSSGSSFTGNFYASKKLDAFNNAPDQASGAQQNIPFTGTPPAGQTLHGWSRYGFTSTDDGVVRSLALVQSDNSTLGSAAQMRGTAIVKGAFNGGTFTWTTDTLCPDALINGSARRLVSNPQMAWNESGTVGYVVMSGVLNSASGANRGYQPIVYKTTNSGASWSQVTGIDFNDPAMNQVTDHLAAVRGSQTLAIPYFNEFDITVDASDKLHIGATIISTYSQHDDSLGYISQFTTSINPNDQYYWAHVPGNRPYVYDFIGDGSSAWMVKTIDSLATEDPGATSQSTGYVDNPWDNTGTNNSKINIDSRLQLGRTPDGKFITFSWAESDTNFTVGQKKYNTIPNLTARCMATGSGANSYVVSPTEINVTKVAAGQGTNNPAVNSRATLHYMSPTTSAATICVSSGSSSTYTADIFTPFTVTNSNPYSQLTNNVTWFGSAKLSYQFTGSAAATCTIQSINENAFALSNSVLYPNPASQQTNISMNLNGNSPIKVIVYNAIGQSMKEAEFKGAAGENIINLNVEDLKSGIYFVSIQAGEAKGTKKLIVE